MKRELLFIDTGAWIALLSRKDQYHTQAVTFYRTMSPAMLRITSSYIISETYTWLRYKAGYKQASSFITVINRARENNSLEMVLDDIELFNSAQRILHTFSDQDLSYTDAVSLEIMNRKNIRKVFGFDHHFSLAGFELLPA